MARRRQPPLKPMKCKDLQFILPLYPDNVLSDEEQSLAAAHLDSCPVCRQKLADQLEIRNNLRSMARPQLPYTVELAIRNKLAARAEMSAPSRMFQLEGDRRRWVDVWLMPFAVGSLSTILLCFTLLWVVVASEIRPLAGSSTSAAGGSSNTTLLYPYPAGAGPSESDLNPLDYAISRSSFSRESPSINPRGPLIALTRDLVEETKDEEVTVVADVYGNGSASITEVVEASSDARAVDELQRALNSNTEVAAFVPASFDRRAEPVRVVLKFQNVNVDTKLR